MSRKLAITSLIAIAIVAGISVFALGSSTEQAGNGPNVFFYSGGGAYLGVNIQDITADRMASLKLKEERGVEVTMVDQDAPAGKAGLKEHDVILDYHGNRVESEEQLRRMLHETPAGRTITLGISRDGNPMSIKVELAERNKMISQSMRTLVFPTGPSIDINTPDTHVFNMQWGTVYAGYLGVQTETLGRQLAEYFGVKEGEGVLVRSVEKGSAAEKAGIKAGDVITKADNEKLSDSSDLRRIITRHRRDGGKLTLGIVRDKREQTIVVDLPARRSNESRVFSWDGTDDADVEIGPEINEQIALSMERAQKALEQAQKVKMVDVEKAMRDAEKQLRDSEKQQKLIMKQLKRSDTI
jgi:serine protease Do